MSPLPKYDDLFWPVLRSIHALGGSAGNDEIDEWVARELALSDDQLSITNAKTGANVFKDRCSWARSFLSFPGFLTRSRRSVWAITELGEQALVLGMDHVSRVVREAAAERRESNRAKRSAPARDTTSPPAEPESVLESAAPSELADQADLDWDDQVQLRMLALRPDAFERLCQRVLRESGFVKVLVTGRTGDGGIDGQGVLRVNLISFNVAFQCKRYRGSVGAPTVRDFRGAMQGRADKGLIITTGTFTPDARREATRDGAPAIDLIDGQTLVELLKEHRLGVKVEQVERVTLDDAFFAEI